MVYIDVGGAGAFERGDGQYLLTHMEGGIAWAEWIGVFRDEGGAGPPDHAVPGGAAPTRSRPISIRPLR